MKPMSFREVVKIVEQAGFTLGRSSKHIIYVKNGIHLAIPHTREVSPGTLRDILRQIKKAG